MKRMLLALCATSALAFATPAAAADSLTWDNITYTLTLDSVSGNTGNFTLDISGINTGADANSGRTGFDAFAFTDPTIGTAISGTSAGFTFYSYGLNSGGCKQSEANFFCFGGLYTLAAGATTASIDFSVTSDTAGSWTNWSPSFKIDWIGSANNYDLVSQPITVNGGVPEPATWAMMLLGFAGVGMTMRRRRSGQVLAQVA